MHLKFLFYYFKLQITLQASEFKVVPFSSPRLIG